VTFVTFFAARFTLRCTFLTVFLADFFATFFAAARFFALFTEVFRADLLPVLRTRTMPVPLCYAANARGNRRKDRVAGFASG
jgi:hypothetical protein